MRELLRSNALVGELVDGDRDVVEQILQVFRWSEVAFGPREFLDNELGFWRSEIQYFATRELPLEFVAMAFPYKVPNPVKTGSRVAPDAGESLMLLRFVDILAALRRVYAPGARLTILEEGILGRCQGVSPAEIAMYRAGIPLVKRVAGVDDETVAFFSLDALYTHVPNFEARWYFEQERLRAQWESGDQEMVAAYRDVFPGQRAGVPLRDIEPDVILRALADADDSSVRYVREYIDAVAHREFFAYRSLLNIRDASNIIGEVSPHALKLTVSPKPRNLAAIPINTWTDVLPYHGAPVRSVDGRWTVEYYSALGTLGPLRALHVAGDPDPAPFAFQRLS